MESTGCFFFFILLSDWFFFLASDWLMDTGFCHLIGVEEYCPLLVLDLTTWSLCSTYFESVGKYCRKRRHRKSADRKWCHWKRRDRKWRHESDRVRMRNRYPRFFLQNVSLRMTDRATRSDRKSRDPEGGSLGMVRNGTFCTTTRVRK